MAVSLKLTCMAVLCMAVVLTADAAISCGTVSSQLAPCLNYLARGGRFVPVGCCNGVRGLKRLARTTSDRQIACRCLQAAARSMGPAIAGRAGGLPSACGVRIPYPISLNTNCNNVK